MKHQKKAAQSALVVDDTHTVTRKGKKYYRAQVVHSGGVSGGVLIPARKHRKPRPRSDETSDLLSDGAMVARAIERETGEEKRKK